MAVSQTEIIDDNGLKILNNESINEKLISIITEIIKDIRLAIINNEGIDKELISKITEIARKSDSLICKVRQIILKDIENGIYEWLDYIDKLCCYCNHYPNSTTSMFGNIITITDIINKIPLIIENKSINKNNFFNKLQKYFINTSYNINNPVDHILLLINILEKLSNTYETKISQLKHQNKIL